MSNKRTKIVIGAPVFGSVAPEILEDWMRWMFHCGRRLPDYDFFTAIRTKREQFRARNDMVEEAMKLNADYLFMIDDDMVVNPFVTSLQSDSYSLIERLVARDKDIVGALYHQRTGQFAPVAMVKTTERGYRFLRDDELTGDLQKVDVVGGGAMLIKMSVFDKIAQPFFAPEHEFGTDVQLCRAAAAKGFEIWLDSSFELGHLKEERVIVTGRNKSQFALGGIPGETKQFIATEVYDKLIADATEWTGYMDADAMARVAQNFMKEREAFVAGGGSDPEWYRKYPHERVARQVWYNSTAAKRTMTEFILASIPNSPPLRILDFGCGIGLPAFTLAQRGHRVTALDIDGTGTFEFLKWRCKKHGVNVTFHNSAGEVPALGSAQFDIVIAMDTLEHIASWKRVLREFADRMEPGAVLFANNMILDDDIHPEHYRLKPAEFASECISLGLVPVNQITYARQATR